MRYTLEAKQNLVARLGYFFASHDPFSLSIDALLAGLVSIKGVEIKIVDRETLLSNR
jgi:hypothetical protein